jgi:flagellar biosynthesis/type III secretory pathway M-ring protein FliF/YscJ
MTIRMDEGEVIAALVGSGIFVLAIVIGAIWLLYLLVRPRRRRRRQEREEREAGFSPSEAEQMIRLMERMEERLDVLERVVAQDGSREERILEAGEGPELRRIK